MLYTGGCGLSKVFLPFVVGVIVGWVFSSYTIVIEEPAMENFSQKDNVELTFYSMVGCGYCVNFMASGDWEKIKDRYGNKIRVLHRVLDRAGSSPVTCGTGQEEEVCQQEYFNERGITSYPAFDIRVNGKQVSNFKDTGLRRDFNGLSQWIDATLKQN